MMAQAAPDVLDELVDQTQMALQAANVPDCLDQDAVKAMSAQIASVLQKASARRLVRVANVARHLLRLLASMHAEAAAGRGAPTVRRGLDVMSLLAQDAERQRAGCPPAALDDAVDCFVDQVERCIRGERGARIMLFPQSRARAGRADLPSSCPTPAGTP